MQVLESKEPTASFVDPAIVSKSLAVKSQPNEASQKNLPNHSRQPKIVESQSKNEFVYTIAELLAIRESLGNLPPPPDLPPITFGDDSNLQQSEQRTEDHNHEREHRNSRERRLPAWARTDTSAPTPAFSFTDFAPKDKDIRDLSEQENLHEEKEKPIRTVQRKGEGRTEKSTWKRDEVPPGFAPRDKVPRGDRSADSENRKERKGKGVHSNLSTKNEPSTQNGREETQEGNSGWKEANLVNSLEIILSPPRKVFPSSQLSPVAQRKKQQGKEKVYAPINASNEAPYTRERDSKDKETKEQTKEPKETKFKASRGNREGETSQGRSQKFAKKVSDVEKAPSNVVSTSEPPLPSAPNTDYSVTSSAVGNMNFIDALFASAQSSGDVVTENDKEDDSDMSRAFKRWFAANQEAAKQQHQLQQKAYEEKLEQARTSNTPSPQIDISQSQILSVLFNKSSEKAEKTEKTEKSEKVEKVEKTETPKSVPPAPKTPSKLPDDPAIISSKKPTTSPVSSTSEPQSNILKMFENPQPTSSAPSTVSPPPKTSQTPTTPTTPKERPITLEELFKSAQGASLPPPPVAKAVTETKIIKGFAPPTTPNAPSTQPVPSPISPRGQTASFVPQESDSTSFINSLLNKTPNKSQPFMDPFTNSFAPQEPFTQPFGNALFGQQSPYRPQPQVFQGTPGVPQPRQNFPFPPQNAPQQEGDLSKWFGNNVYQAQVQPMPPMPSNVKMVSLEEIERSARSRK